MSSSDDGGAPAKKKWNPWPWIFIVSPVLLVGSCLLNVATADDEPADPATVVYEACLPRIREQLKAPDSADFPTEFRVRSEQNSYTVIGTVQATNSFGAEVTTSWQCTATYGEASETASVVSTTLD